MLDRPTSNPLRTALLALAVPVATIATFATAAVPAVAAPPIAAQPAAPAAVEHEADPVLLYPVKVDGRWGYIDAEGEIAIEPAFDEAEAFSDGLARVRSDGAWLFIDQEGDAVLEPGLLYVGSFHEGRAPARAAEGEPLGYIDRSGDWAIEPRFGEAYAFSEGLAAVYTGSSTRATPDYGYIDRDGAWVIEPQYWGARRFSEGVAPVQVDGFVDGVWGFIDPDGSWVIEPRFETALPFSDGRAVVAVGEGFDALWGFIDRTGEVVIEAEYEMAQPFSEGLGLVEGPFDEWYYVDMEGERALGGDFPVAEPFRGRLARVAYEGSVGYQSQGGTLSFMTGDLDWHYIDRSGAEVWPEPEERAADEAGADEPLDAEAATRTLMAALPESLPGGLTGVERPSPQEDRPWPAVMAAYGVGDARVRVSVEVPPAAVFEGMSAEVERAAADEADIETATEGDATVYFGPASGGASRLILFLDPHVVQMEGDVSTDVLREAARGMAEVLEVGVEAGAHASITHNVRDFDGVEERFGVRVVRPGAFLQQLKESMR